MNRTVFMLVAGLFTSCCVECYGDGSVTTKHKKTMDALIKQAKVCKEKGDLEGAKKFVQQAKEVQNKYKALLNKVYSNSANSIKDHKACMFDIPKDFSPNISNTALSNKVYSNLDKFMKDHKFFILYIC